MHSDIYVIHPLNSYNSLTLLNILNDLTTGFIIIIHFPNTYIKTYTCILDVYTQDHAVCIRVRHKTSPSHGLVDQLCLPFPLTQCMLLGIIEAMHEEVRQLACVLRMPYVYRKTTYLIIRYTF